MNFNPQTNARFVKKLLCGASLGALATMIAGQALAQAPATEEVTVTATGTSIKGIAPVGTNLITVDAADIKATGAITTEEILGQIPQLANTFNTQTVSPTAINIGGVRPSIRYNPAQNILGLSSTLVLLDGHNLVGVSGLATTPDAGLIPTIVLQRVDVIPDGASSIYGANAIAGVINFVTRETYQGFQANISAGVADGYSAFNAGMMVGTDWGTGGVYGAFEHKENTYLMARDRSYTKMDLTGIGGRDSRGTSCDLANISVPGAQPNNYALTSNQVGFAPGSLKAAASGPFGALNATTNAGSLNRCDTNSYASLFPREEQNSFFGQFHQRIMPGVEFSTKFLWSTRLDSAINPELSATNVAIDNTNPYFQSINGETTQNVSFAFGPFWGSQSVTDYNNVQEFQITPKLTVDLPFGDWQAIATFNYGRSNTTGFNRSVNTALLAQSMRRSVVAGTLSPALVASPSLAGNAVDPYNLTAGNPLLIDNILNTGSYGKAIQHQIQWGGQANGTLFSLPGGDVKAALGGQWAFEDYVANWNTNWPIGTVAGPAAPGAQMAIARPHRITNTGFAEINVPIVGKDNELPFVHALTFNVSGRIDSYSDFGNTENYKIGISYEPFEALTIRATNGTSYDAPSLADTAAPDTRFTYTAQRTAANTNVPPGTSAADALRPSISTPGGNPQLGPETGRTWSIGGDFHPTTELGVDLSGLTVSITAFHTKFEHQQGLILNNPGLLFSGAYNQYYILNPTLAQVQARYPTNFNAAGNATVATTGFPGPDLASAFNTPGVNQPYILYDLRRNNLGEALIEGLDIALNYTTDIEDFGSLSGGFSGTFTTTNTNTPAPGLAAINLVQYSFPLSAMTAFVAATVGPVTGRVTVNYSPGFNVSPVLNQALSLYGQKRIEAFHPVNLFVSYDLSGLAPWLADSEASVAMNNVGDDSPPIYLS
ncbi:MAG: TonB-dependent receptor, partial [Alphaproteobacteria bacterium]|nr:TonB-dependent receptor [Alphaproteobacteria bacterium]